ncbi:hypothetical protein CCP4SC76_2400004 [Gammaproteobacteria bacterium]
MPGSEENMANRNNRPAIENQDSNLVWYDRESDLVALERKELRLQKKLYTLLLVMAVGFGGLALSCTKWLWHFAWTWMACEPTWIAWLPPLR